jgi:preprotein translocase subunit SecD
LRRKLVYVIGIVAVAVAGVVYTLAAGNEPLLGLDLQGGASVVLEPTRVAAPEELDVAVEIIRNRVDGLGVAEPEISTQGDNILVQLPGVDEQQRALDLVGQTAELRFRPVLSVVAESSLEGADEALLDLFALSEGDVAAGADVVLPQYDDDRNIAARYQLGPTAVAGDGLEGAVAQFHSFIG